MTPEIAWAEAMKFEHRPNPYPFFDELRKAPVARIHTDIHFRIRVSSVLIRGYVTGG